MAINLNIRFSYTCFTIILFTIAAAAQQLDTDGHVRVRGRMDVGHMDDLRSISIGLNAGLLTDYSAIRNNTFLGYFSGFRNTSGAFNSFYGSCSGLSNTRGGSNSFYGFESGLNNTDGSVNTGLGLKTMYSNTLGGENTALGGMALFNNQTGNFNTAIGVNALATNKKGNYNTAIGHSADFGTDSVDNFTCLGYAAGAKWIISNTVEIGNFSVQWIGGQTPWFTYSDARIKRDVQENVPGLSFINRLRPVTYHLDIRKQYEMAGKNHLRLGDWKGKYDVEKIAMSGFIAQEVAEAAREIDYDFSGVHQTRGEVEIYSLSYGQFVVPLVKAVQELEERINHLLAENQRLRQIFETMDCFHQEKGLDEKIVVADEF